MKPHHHPSAQALANLLIGDCSPGAALLIARHVENCSRCTLRVQGMGAIAASPADFRCDAPEALRPGVEIARVQGVSGLGEAVFLLCAEPSETLDLEEPLPVAEILVLKGGFTADGAAYKAGDFLSLEDRKLGSMMSDAGAGCRCLITCSDASGVAAA